MSTKEINWKKVWDWIIQFLESLIKTQNSTGQQPKQSETLSDATKTVATQFLENKGLELYDEYRTMLESLSPKQKELVKKMAVIKSVNISELTLEESIELGDMVNEAANLNLEINKEVSKFWSKVGSIAKDAAVTFGEYGVKTAARALVGFIPI